MNVISVLEDKRIQSKNILVEFKIQEYLKIADSILKNNPFQRGRVKSSSTVYSLLRDDLKTGCVIPPIVLAITQGNFSPLDTNDRNFTQVFEEFIQGHLSQVIILDGLQRTYNIIDANTELESKADEEGLTKYHNSKLRCEFYLGIDKIGILYRMLTLNTGQTPMSLRHQIEILYSDYLQHAMDGIELIKEIDERAPRKSGQYSFKEIIEGFTSYLTRDYLTFDKADILGNIKSLEKLSKENQGYDIFKNYTNCYHKFQIQIQKLLMGWEFDYEENQSMLSGPAYGKNAKTIFDKSQTMTGLGAAVGFLIDRSLVNDFDDVAKDIPRIHFSADIDTSMLNLLLKLDDIRKNAPKIGNAQRAYFFYFFRELFNHDGDSYLVIDEAIENAFKRYRQNA